MTSTPPALRGVHHLKIPVSDLSRSVEFYTAVFGARRIAEADHVDAAGQLYACILDIADLGTLLELRLDPGQASAMAGFDPVTIAVDDRAALAAWRAHLDALEVPHSDEIVAIQAWLIVLADPDGIRLRFYTLERHGPELTPGVDDPWLTSLHRR
jgi:catechol 2,3-dioxygenase-like lactoylglutathione lyase family enzyme